MKTHSHRRVARLGVLASSLALVWPGIGLAEDELAALTRPEGTVRLGVGHLADDSPRLGQYGGPRDKGAYLLLDAELLRRQDDSGTWWRLSARNLGLDAPELRIGAERQGAWGVDFEYSRIARFEPLTVTTGATGIGGSTLVLKGTTPREVQLSTERDRYTLTLDRTLAEGLAVQLRWRGENKQGARLWGRGGGEFLAEPLGAQTHQLEATLNWVSPAVQLSGGYLGSAYLNRWAALDVATGTDIALPPDNQSHQLFVSGGLRLTPGTRATFKLARSRGIQNDGFFTRADFPGNTATTLDGRVDTDQAQFGLTARPWSMLSLALNLRWEDRDDKTPRRQFLVASTGRDGFNTPFSRRNANGKVEATLHLGAGTSVLAGVEVDERKRSVLAVRQASWRERNDETTWRLEARRGLADGLNGRIAWLRSRRGGSDYLPANNNAAADVIDPLHFADRDRDRVRASVDWAPLESMSLQLVVDEARDTYDGRPLGPEMGKARLLALDLNVNLSDDWQLTGWVSHDDTHVHQATMTGANTTLVAAQTWRARLRSTGDATGVTLRGRPSSRFELGADLQWARDLARHALEANLPAAALLPDIATRRQTLKLFGQYTLSSTLALRLDLMHDRLRSNDWTWSGWTYTDGTVVQLDPRQRTTWVGLSVQYRLW